MQARSSKKVVAKNRRANFDYDIQETYSAGIVLRGAEVKSAKLGSVSLKESFVRVERGEVWLINAHISSWKYARNLDYDPKMRRKLLLNRREIKKLTIRMADFILKLHKTGDVQPVSIETDLLKKYI